MQLQTAMTLVALANMHVTYASVPQFLLDWIDTNLVAGMAVFQERAVSGLIYALGKMSWTWSANVSPALKSVIRDAVTRHLPTMSAMGVDRTIVGLSLMKVKWFSLPSVLKETIEQQLLKHESSAFNNQQDSLRYFVNAVDALGRMEADFNAFSPALQQALQNGFNKYHNNFSAKELSAYIFGYVCLHSLSPSLLLTDRVFALHQDGENRRKMEP